MTQLNPPTYKQLDYLRTLQRKHKISDRMLHVWCEERYGIAFTELDRRQMSVVIDEMASWESVPAEMRRATGQLDLFGTSA